MEVHHHPHAPSHLKHWKEYLLEFFMIFLAVTMGFFAESYRERGSEKGKEMKYMESMVADLQKDTLSMNQAIQENLRQFRGMDSLAQQLHLNPSTDVELRRLYRLNDEYALSLATQPVNDMTMRQLLSSGNLRLISDQKVADRIMEYYGSEKEVYDQDMSMYLQNIQKVFFASVDLFDFRYPPIQIHKDTTFSSDYQHGDFKLLNHDPAALDKYANQVMAARALNIVYINVLHEMEKQALELMMFLKKEYHLSG